MGFVRIVPIQFPENGFKSINSSSCQQKYPITTNTRPILIQRDDYSCSRQQARPWQWQYHAWPQRHSPFYRRHRKLTPHHPFPLLPKNSAISPFKTKMERSCTCRNAFSDNPRLKQSNWPNFSSPKVSRCTVRTGVPTAVDKRNSLEHKPGRK